MSVSLHACLQLCKFIAMLCSSVANIKCFIVLKAISVAERVADERCESSPGSNDSLVGYQVRLDSARWSLTLFTD